jgi:hypothetical protein
VRDQANTATRDVEAGAFLAGYVREAGIQVEGFTVDILAATTRAHAQQTFTELLHGPH